MSAPQLEPAPFDDSSSLLHSSSSPCWSSFCTYLRNIRSILSAKNIYIIVLMIATVVVSAFDFILWKKALNRFHAKEGNTTYTFFVLQIYVLMLLVMSSVATFLCIFVFKIIDDKQRTFPKSKFIMMSAFDTASQLLTSMSSAVVAGHLQTLFNQAMLPLLVIFAVFFLKTKYLWLHYVACAIILAGTFLDAIPNLNAADSSGRKTQIWGVILYALSSIPYAGGNTYREYIFKSGPKLHIFYLMFWTGLFQFALTILTTPVLMLPIFGGLKIHEIYTQFTQGSRCFVGLHVEELSCEQGVPPGVLLSAYVIMNFIVSILRLLLIKHGSAIILQITNALALVASNMLFSIRFVMRDETEKFNIFDIFGLIVVLIGFVLFRIASFRQEKQLAEDDEAAAAASGNVEDNEDIDGNNYYSQEFGNGNNQSEGLNDFAIRNSFIGGNHNMPGGNSFLLPEDSSLVRVSSSMIQLSSIDNHHTKKHSSSSHRYGRELHRPDPQNIDEFDVMIPPSAYSDK